MENLSGPRPPDFQQVSSSDQTEQVKSEQTPKPIEQERLNFIYEIFRFLLAGLELIASPFVHLSQKVRVLSKDPEKKEFIEPEKRESSLEITNEIIEKVLVEGKYFPQGIGFKNFTSNENLTGPEIIKTIIQSEPLDQHEVVKQTEESGPIVYNVQLPKIFMDDIIRPDNTLITLNKEVISYHDSSNVQKEKESLSLDQKLLKYIEAFGTGKALSYVAFLSTQAALGDAAIFFAKGGYSVDSLFSTKEISYDDKQITIRLTNDLTMRSVVDPESKQPRQIQYQRIITLNKDDLEKDDFSKAKVEDRYRTL